MTSAALPTIRQLVSALTLRPGVQAVVVLSHDGLLIDGQSAPGHDMELIAAHVPVMVGAATQLGATGERGELVMAVLEYAGGYAIVAKATDEALLLLFAGHSANFGELIADLRRHRRNIASIM